MKRGRRGRCSRRRCEALRELDRLRRRRRSRRRCAALIERLGRRSRRQLFQPMRVAITGTHGSPGIFESLAALGRERDAGAHRGRARAACCEALRAIDRVEPLPMSSWARLAMPAGRNSAETADSRRHADSRPSRTAQQEAPRHQPQARRVAGPAAASAWRPRFEAVERLPALAESQRRAGRELRAEAETPRPTRSSEAVESDAALAIAVMRAANNGAGPARPRLRRSARRSRCSTPDGVASGRRATLDTYELFEHGQRLARPARALPRHAVATRHAAERIAEIATAAGRDELAVAALLHDVGKLVLAGSTLLRTSSEPTPRGTPRSASGASAASSASTTRWSAACWPAAGALPPSIAGAIERHHAADADGHRRRGQARRPRRPPRHRRHGLGRAPRRAAAALGLDADARARARLRVPATRAAAPAHQRAVPAVGPRARRAARPRRGQGLQGDRRARCRCRRARCAPTCTTSTARSARWIAPRRCSSPATAAGSSRPRLLDQALAQPDRDRVGAVAGLEAGEDRLRVGPDRLARQARGAWRPGPSSGRRRTS